VVGGVCKAVEPTERRIDATHKVSCHIYDEVPA
jgi:peptide/nickel transport system ATP-binding protein